MLAAIAAANDGHQIAYGEDDYTARLQEVFAQHFGEGVEAFPVFNGTGANVVGLQSMLPRWGAVIAASTAHINVDEGGAPERVARHQAAHRARPTTASSPPSSSTARRGAGATSTARSRWSSRSRSPPSSAPLYTVDEMRAIADHAHALGMKLHLDGARISNAAASLGVPLRAFTRDVGVDVLSFGGTKNGAMLGEAIVVLDPEASAGLTYLRKLNMQLSSKMRFVSAQLIALLEGDLWLRNASHANAMAAAPARRASRPASPTGRSAASRSRSRRRRTASSRPCRTASPTGCASRFRFYDWDAAKNEVRWMCSFDTTEADIDAFIAAIARETSA